MFCKTLAVAVLSLFPILSCNAIYLVKDLGLNEIGNSKPIAINDRNEVVGTVQIEGKKEFFHWSPESGHTILYQIPQGATIVQMNNLSQVIGNYLCWEGLWSPKQVVHPFIWSYESGFVDLESIESEDTYAISINDTGRVLLVTKSNECFLWENSAVSKIKEASQLYKENGIVSAALSNQEFVCVKSQLAQTSGPFTILHKDLTTGHVTLPNFPYEKPMLKSLNGKGTLIGTFILNGQSLGFIEIKNGRCIPLPNFQPNALNEGNDVVGILTTPRAHGAILLANMAFYDINALLLPKEKQTVAYDEVISLEGINNKGVMAGTIRCGMGKHAAIVYSAHTKI